MSGRKNHPRTQSLGDLGNKKKSENKKTSTKTIDVHLKNLKLRSASQDLTTNDSNDVFSVRKVFPGVGVYEGDLYKGMRHGKGRFLRY